MIKVVDDYFAKGCGRCDRFDTPDCSTRQWLEGLEALRRICLDEGLEEVAKWGQPTYMASGRNIVILGAFRNDFRLAFFHPALMQDPAGVLVKQGPNAKHKGSFCFQDNGDVAKNEDVIRAYLKEAMGYAEAGIKPPKEAPDELDMPVELDEALQADVELATAFAQLTPGRQRSYLFNLNGAKKSSTRVNRIAKFRDKIIAGKGANEY